MTQNIITPSINTPNVSAALNQEEVTITYKDNGFSPAEITIKSQTTVTFENQSSQSLWVASNPHPVHTDYLGFDAKQDLKTGSKYRFTFDKIGRFGYHNHLNPSQRGLVIVE